MTTTTTRSSRTWSTNHSPWSWSAVAMMLVLLSTLLVDASMAWSILPGSSHAVQPQSRRSSTWTSRIMVQSSQPRRTTRQFELQATSSAFAQRPGESNSDYMKRLTKLASDASLFEQTVLSSSHHDSNAASSSTAQHASLHSDQEEEPKRRGYVRAEEWDKEQTAKLKEGLSWQERVQYDGLRFGNGVQQNEILRKNLSGF